MTPAAFQEATASIAYAHRGVFFSELYLFVTHCLEQGVTRIIESGVHHGVSTRVLRAIWPGRVVSIEFRSEHVPADLDGVVVGDGRILVPTHVNASADDRIGVLLDGPKGARAIEIREWCLAQDHVRVVAQHDWPAARGEDAHSHDRWYQHEIGAALDERIPLALRAPYVHGGPGLGLWINRRPA